MIEVEVEYGTAPELTAEMVRAQLESLVNDDVFRSSKRSVAFLRYVVERTLDGASDRIKERSIGVEVFGRDPSYDTNADHIVRTAATELRRRLATYYVDEKHRCELRMGLTPGSYVPRFAFPHQTQIGLEALQPSAATEPGNGHAVGGHAAGPAVLAEPAPSAAAASWLRRGWLWGVGLAAVVVLSFVSYAGLHRPTPQDLFWKPVVDTPGAVLLAVGGHPNGPPTIPAPAAASDEGSPTPVPSSDTSQTVPFADSVTLAYVTGALESRNKQVVIRRGNASSFSDLREGAAVLIGAFNNEWSLRLTRSLRFSLALDADRSLIYIKDATEPLSRKWSWATNQPRELMTGPNSPKIQDYALISRIRDAGTGHVVVVIGGLYTYGTQAAGEFLTNPDLMREAVRQTKLNATSQNLQIVLGTSVTDGIPGPPRILAVSSE
jgi:hypothetical protein